MVCIWQWTEWKVARYGGDIRPYAWTEVVWGMCEEIAVFTSELCGV